MTSLGHLDHVAIVVTDTEMALRLWRDRLGFRVIHSEVVNGGAVRLTHLQLGGTHLQFVEPLVPEHPLHQWLQHNGQGLHHLCFAVEELDAAIKQLATHGIAAATPHQGTNGRRAAFLDRASTDGVLVELTGK